MTVVGVVAGVDGAVVAGALVLVAGFFTVTVVAGLTMVTVVAGRLAGFFFATEAGCATVCVVRAAARFAAFAAFAAARLATARAPRALGACSAIARAPR